MQATARQGTANSASCSAYTTQDASTRKPPHGPNVLVASSMRDIRSHLTCSVQFLALFVPLRATSRDGVRLALAGRTAWSLPMLHAHRKRLATIALFVAAFVLGAV